MVRRGSRKPKPTVLKLHTNKQFKGRPEEPKPASDAVKPDWLTEIEEEFWDWQAPELIRLGLLTGVDVPTFAILCRLYAKIRTSPKVNTSDAAEFRRMCGVFGMTPSDRPRLKVPSEADEVRARSGLR